MVEYIIKLAISHDILSNYQVLKLKTICMCIYKYIILYKLSNLKKKKYKYFSQNCWMFAASCKQIVFNVRTASEVNA